MTIDRPNEPGFYYERTSGKYFRVFKSDTGSLLADEYGDDYRTLKWLTELPAGNWQKLGVPVTAGEADKQFREWLTQSKHCPCGIHRCMDIADKAAEIFAGVQEGDKIAAVSAKLEKYKRVLIENQDFCGAAAVKDCLQLLNGFEPKLLSEVEDQIAGLKSELKDALHERDGLKQAIARSLATAPIEPQPNAELSQLTTMQQTIARLEGEVGDLKGADAMLREVERIIPRNDAHRDYSETVQLFVEELKRDRANFENGCDHLADDVRRFKKELDAAVHHHEHSRNRIDKALGEPRYDGCDIWTGFERRIAELKDLKPAPQPEVIEGRGQAVRLALCQAAENLADIGESLVSLSQSLRESPPRKPAFVAPEKPEQVLIRTQRGELYWATKADGDWWLAVGGGWHRNVKPIDPVTGEPIAKEEA